MGRDTVDLDLLPLLSFHHGHGTVHAMYIKTLGSRGHRPISPTKPYHDLMNRTDKTAAGNSKDIFLSPISFPQRKATSPSQHRKLARAGGIPTFTLYVPPPLGGQHLDFQITEDTFMLLHDKSIRSRLA